MRKKYNKYTEYYTQHMENKEEKKKQQLDNSHGDESTRCEYLH